MLKRHFVRSYQTEPNAAFIYKIKKSNFFIKTKINIFAYFRQKNNFPFSLVHFVKAFFSSFWQTSVLYLDYRII